MKAAMGAADPTRKAAMTTDHDDDFEPHHTSSPTDQVLHELQLYGYRPFNDEPDPRPLPEANILAGSISDIFDALVVGAGRHSPRTRPRGPALVDGERLSSGHRADRARTRRQRAGPAALAAGTGRQRGQIRRAGTTDGGRPDDHRTPQRLRADARPGRRTVRAPHPFNLAAAQRVEGQPSQSDLRDDRQPRFPGGEEARRQPGAPARGTEGGIDRRARLQRSPADLGQARPRSTPSTPTWCCCTAARRRAPS